MVGLDDLFAEQHVRGAACGSWRNGRGVGHSRFDVTVGRRNDLGAVGVVELVAVVLGGLWLAVITMPAWARRCRTAKAVMGVGSGRGSS
jgi:hypothetical protein